VVLSGLFFIEKNQQFIQHYRKYRQSAKGKSNFFQNLPLISNGKVELTQSVEFQTGAMQVTEEILLCAINSIKLFFLCASNILYALSFPDNSGTESKLFLMLYNMY